MITAVQQCQSRLESAEKTVGSQQEERQMLRLCFLNVCLTADVGIYFIYLFICAALDKKIVANSTKSFYKKQDAAFVKIPFQRWEVLWTVNN